jgi:hypothetical protein
MTLLSRSQVKRFAPPADDGAMVPLMEQPPVTGGPASFRVGKHGVDLHELLPELLPDHTYPIITNGHWSLHEMIAYLVQHTGSAAVHMTTWGITAEPLKSFLRLQELGHLTDVNCFFDSRIRKQCPEAYQLLLHAVNERKIKVSLGKTHAKIVVLVGPNAAYAICTSANLTNNPRVEAYVLMTHRDTALAFRTVIDQLIAGGNPFSA